MAIPLTLQARIAKALENSLDSMLDIHNVNGQGVDKRFWNKTTQGPISGQSALSYPLISTEQGPEATSQLLFPFEDKVLTMYSEFTFAPVYGDLDSFDMFRYYLGRIQGQLFGTLERKTLGGLSLDIMETNNQPQIESQDDTAPGGLITYQVYYRAVQGNPFITAAEMEQYG